MMPSFCLPCWPSRAILHSEDPQQCSPAEDWRAGQGSDELEKPTPAEYVGDAAKEFLKVLVAVAELIPVPGVGAAVKIATKIIQACDESHATLERAEELKLRIKMLVTILVQELKTKKAEEIQDKLQEDITSLSSNLQYIQGKLNEIASQHAFLVIILKSVNEDKVRKCITRLDNALESFSLAREINDANLLNKLEQQIRLFHDGLQKTVENIQVKVDKAQVTMDSVKAILEKHLLPTSSTSRPHSRSAIPANTGIFHGRDALVAKLACSLTAASSEGQKRTWVCLLGPGGMGKTLVSLAVMAHADMQKHFPSRNQIWIPCVKATSVSLFLDTLYLALGIRQNTGNTLQDIISELKSSAEPLILLLDNFETPWNVDGGRSDAERILNDLHQIPHITIFVTMRSSVPPGLGIYWHAVNLEAIDQDAARQIYLDIYPESCDDAALPKLLQVVGYMPLAVTLMATLGKTVDLGAEELMEQYNANGTAMLKQGSDARHNMEICISLSVDSPPMKNLPEAYELLSILAMLPVGTTYGALTKWWARHLLNPTGALQVLRETALIQGRKSNYFVLPVVRSYILDQSRLPETVRVSMIESTCNFLEHHKSSVGDPSFLNHAKALSLEESNLQAILLDITVPELRSIEAFLVLARHQVSTRARLNVIEYALKLVRQMESNQKLLGDVLDCYGWMLRYLGLFDDALKQFNLAHETFLLIDDQKQAARSLLNSVDVYGFMDSVFRNDTRLVRQAMSVFQMLGDTHGIALSLRYLGQVYGHHSRYAKGIVYLIRAREMFQDLKDPLNHAHCLYQLSQIYLWDERWADAQEAATSAVQEYQHLSQYPGDAIQIIGRALLQAGQYPSALEMLVECLRISKSYGYPLAIAQSFEGIGYVWEKMDQKKDARSAYAEAMEVYEALQSGSANDGMVRCQFLVQRLDNPSLIPDSRERSCMGGWYADFWFEGGEEDEEEDDDGDFSDDEDGDDGDTGSEF